MSDRTALSFFVAVGLSMVTYNTMGDARIMATPKPEEHPNPYVLLDRERVVEGNGQYPWEALVNKAGAKFSSGGRTFELAYLRRVGSIDAGRGLCNVVVLEGPRQGAIGRIDMLDLILFDHAIKSDAGLLQKVFVKVRVFEAKENPEGVDALRFRNHPSNPSEGGRASYLTSRESVDQVSAYWYYLYGIHFSESDREQYLNLDGYRHAEYFLLGEDSVLSTDPDDPKIMGWLHHSAVVLWSTRQAPEPSNKEGSRERGAHVFKRQGDLLAHYMIRDDGHRASSIAGLVRQGRAERDQSGGRSLPSQWLRPLILDKFTEDVVPHARVGFSQLYGDTTVLDVATTQGPLSRTRKLKRRTELFFLVDATTSMKDSLVAAAEVVRKISRDFAGRLESETGVGLTVKAAVYRDASEGLRWYEEWVGGSTEELADWLANMNAISANRDDYPEALYDGIAQALNGWRTHEGSNRYMFILGDAGDNGRGEHSSRTVLEALSDAAVKPVPIHVDHPMRGSRSGDRAKCDNGAKPAEQQEHAMCAFQEEMAALKRQFYGGELAIVPTVDVKRVQGELEGSVTRAVQAAVVFVEVIDRLRRGRMSEAEQQFVACVAREGRVLPCEWLAKKSGAEPERLLTLDPETAGFVASELKLLFKSSAGWEEIFTRKQQIGFWEGFMAIDDVTRGASVSEPVLLLSRSELIKIRSDIDQITSNSKRCGNAKSERWIASSLVTILGDLLQLNPQELSVDEVESLFGVVVETSITIDAKRLLKKMCGRGQKARNQWREFIEKFGESRKTVDRLVGRSKGSCKGRIYYTGSDEDYFWVYPDELFPRYDRGEQRRVMEC